MNKREFVVNLENDVNEFLNSNDRNGVYVYNLATDDAGRDWAFVLGWSGGFSKGEGKYCSGNYRLGIKLAFTYGDTADYENDWIIPWGQDGLPNFEDEGECIFYDGISIEDIATDMFETWQTYKGQILNESCSLTRVFNKILKESWSDWDSYSDRWFYNNGHDIKIKKIHRKYKCFTGVEDGIGLDQCYGGEGLLLTFSKVNDYKNVIKDYKEDGSNKYLKDDDDRLEYFYENDTDIENVLNLLSNFKLNFDERFITAVKDACNTFDIKYKQNNSCSENELKLEMSKEDYKKFAKICKPFIGEYLDNFNISYDGKYLTFKG